MAVRTHDEIMNAIKERFADDTIDETLQFIEDISDTINSSVANDNTDWKTRFEENDKMWRQKYKDRFFNGGSDNDAEILGEVHNDEPEVSRNMQERRNTGTCGHTVCCEYRRKHRRYGKGPFAPCRPDSRSHAYH